MEIHLTLGELQFILKTTEKNKENQNKTKKQKNKKKKDTNYNPSSFFRFWCYYHISVVHANMSGTIIHIKLNTAKAKIRIEGNDSHNNPLKKIFHEEAAVTFSSFRDVQKIEILDANYLFRIACTLVRRNARERCLLIHSATN